MFLIVCVLLPTAGLTASATGSMPFSDVRSGDWYADSVQYVHERGLMQGTGNNTFSPNATTTRGMIVTILYRMEDSPRVSSSCPFTDVETASWYGDAVIWAAENNIVSGISQTSFAPNSYITREQMVTIMYRYADYKNYDTGNLADIGKFTDAKSISSWAMAAFKWAVGEGFISGLSADTIGPKGSTSRAQVAAILTRFLKKEMAFEEFKAKDIEDFDGHEIINLDESEETNFAVLKDGTVATKSEGAVNQLVKADEEEGVYVFENINEDISSLSAGNVLYHTYGSGENEYILVKIGSIDIKDGRATISAGQVQLSDLFDYVDIDMEIQVPAENTQPYTLDNQEYYVEEALKTAADRSIGYDDEIFSRTFTWNGSMGGIDITATSTISIPLVVRLGFTVDTYIRASVKTDSNITGEFVKKTDNKPYRVDAPKAVASVEGVDLELNAFFTCGFNASISGKATGNLKTENGFSYQNGQVEGINNFEKDFSANIKGTFDSNIGVGVRSSLVVLKVIKLSLDTEGGIKINGVAEKSVSSQQPDEKHLCALCVDGKLIPYLKMDLEFSIVVFTAENKIWDDNLFDIDIDTFPFYISFLGEGSQQLIEFDWGQCPHRQFRVTVGVTDESGDPAADILIEIKNRKNNMIDESGRTDNSGRFVGYCNNGSYDVTAIAPTGSRNATKNIQISGKPVDITLLLKDSAVTPTPTPTPSNIVASGNCGAQGDNAKWTLDKDGVLTITGTGAMEDYEGSPHSEGCDYEGEPWIDALSNGIIRKVVVGEGITHIGAFAFPWIGQPTYDSDLKPVSVELPSTLESIGSGAFAGANFEGGKIVIPDGVKRIGDHAFWLADLTRITIPASVTQIDMYSLFNYWEGREIQFKGTKQQWEQMKSLIFDWDGGHVVDYNPQGFGIHEGDTVHCTDGNIYYSPETLPPIWE